MNIRQRKKSKRVIGFCDAHDEIPVNAKYLFSKEHTIPLVETDDQRARRVIDGTDDKPTMTIFVHYYEVSSTDYEKLLTEGWSDLEFKDKINAHIDYIKRTKKNK